MVVCSLTPVFSTRKFFDSIVLQDVNCLGSLHTSSGGTKFEIFREHVGYLQVLYRAMNSYGSTLVKCPPKTTGLLLSERFKDLPIIPYQRADPHRYTSSSKTFKTAITLLLSLEIFA